MAKNHSPAKKAAKKKGAAKKAPVKKAAPKKPPVKKTAAGAGRGPRPTAKATANFTGTVTVDDTVLRAFLDGTFLTTEASCANSGFDAAHDAFVGMNNQQVTVDGFSGNCNGLPVIHVTRVP